MHSPNLHIGRANVVCRFVGRRWGRAWMSLVMMLLDLMPQIPVFYVIFRYILNFSLRDGRIWNGLVPTVRSWGFGLDQDPPVHHRLMLCLWTSGLTGFAKTNKMTSKQLHHISWRFLRPNSNLNRLQSHRPLHPNFRDTGHKMHCISCARKQTK